MTRTLNVKHLVDEFILHSKLHRFRTKKIVYMSTHLLVNYTKLTAPRLVAGI